MTTHEYDRRLDDHVDEPLPTDSYDRIEHYRDGTEVPAEVVTEEPLAVRSARLFTPARLLGFAAGAVLIVFGLVALARGDLSGSINDPVVNVAGWPHTPLLGPLEIGAGVVLILSTVSMGTEMLVGALITIAGVVALIEPTVLSDNLSIANAHAWLIVVLGAVPFLAAAVTRMMPLRAHRTVRTPHTVVRV